MAITENSMEVPQKIKTGATIWCRKSNSEYIPKGNEITDIILKIYLHPNVHSSIIYNSQDMEITQASNYRKWIKRELYIYFSHKKEGSPAIWDNIDEPWGIMLK